MKYLILLLCAIIFYDAHATCISKTYRLKLEMNGFSLSIYDKHINDVVMCIKTDKKEIIIPVGENPIPVNAGFFTDAMNYFYVTWMSTDGHLSYNIYESSGRVVADIASGRNMPSIIWTRHDNIILPIICVNNKNIHNYGDDERWETDGVYKYKIRNGAYKRTSHSTKICS